MPERVLLFHMAAFFFQKDLIPPSTGHVLSLRSPMPKEAAKAARWPRQGGSGRPGPAAAEPGGRRQLLPLCTNKAPVAVATRQPWASSPARHGPASSPAPPAGLLARFIPFWTTRFGICAGRARWGERRRPRCSSARWEMCTALRARLRYTYQQDVLKYVYCTYSLVRQMDIYLVKLNFKKCIAFEKRDGLYTTACYEF